MFDYVNKVKYLVNQLTCLEMPVKKKNVVVTLLKNLPPLFAYLITTLETHPMKEFTIDFIIACLMYKVPKRLYCHDNHKHLTTI